MNTAPSAKTLCEMEEKVVLLTGASSGIGAHTVRFLAGRKGWRRLSVVARTRARLEATARALRELGAADVLVLCLDVSRDDECVAAVERTVAHFGSEAGGRVHDSLLHGLTSK